MNVGTGTRTRGADAIVLFGLAVIAVLLFGRVFDVRPFGEDNFYVFSWIDRASAGSLLHLDPSIYPEWRPLAYQTVWLQYQWAGLARMSDYYVFNVGVWVLVAWLVYLLTVQLTASRLAACAAALFVVTEPRAIPAVSWIVERQSSMACLFGLLAWWAVVRSGGRRLAPIELTGVGFALLASALSKEYGLAFSGALLVYGWLERRREIVTSAIAAGLLYAVLRLVFARGAAEPYCGDIGYLFTVRKGACYHADLATAGQMIYNIAATAIGSVLQGLFREDGRLGLARLPLILSSCWLAFTVAGWWMGSRDVRRSWLIVAGNTLLSFMLYQPRNQLVAVVAIALLIGSGVAVLAGQDRARSARTAWMRSAVFVMVGTLLAVQAIRTRKAVSEEVDQLLAQNPCSATAEHPEAVPFAMRVKTLYDGRWDCGASH